MRIVTHVGCSEARTHMSGLEERLGEWWGYSEALRVTSVGRMAK